MFYHEPFFFDDFHVTAFWVCLKIGQRNPVCYLEMGKDDEPSKSAVRYL